MTLKDKKIFIPEIPKSWTKRIRAGDTNIWNEGKDDEVSLRPPITGLYAERFEDGWYWVCGCNKCLENGQSFSYITCHEHNRCISCGTHREDITEIPWGTADGFQCKPCARQEHNEQKAKALSHARVNGHSESDCAYQESVICPECASEHDDPGFYEPGNNTMTCGVCDTEFDVDVEVELRYTATLK